MRRAVSFSAAGWEAVRFLLLFLVMTVQLNRGLHGETTLFLLWISAVSLVLAVALVFAGVFPSKYSMFVPLVAMIKVVQVVFGGILVIYVLTVLQSGFGATRTGVGVAGSLPTIFLIVGIDVLSALFLLLLGVRGKTAEQGLEISISGDDSDGPSARPIEVEEEK